jgi:hypothetical protein
VEKPAFLIAVSKAGDGDISAPPFNFGLQRDGDQATRLRFLFVLENLMQGIPNRDEIGYP